MPSPDRLGLSPDGTVLAYRIDRSNWDDELRITRISDARTLVVPFGRNPEYSADGRWLTYAIGQSEREIAQLKRERRPVRDGLGLLQLSTFSETRFTDVERARMSADGAFIAIERYATRATAGRGAGARRGNDADSPRLYVRALGTALSSAERAFDNVQQFSWQPTGGHRLAMAMGGDNSGGARVQILDPAAPDATSTVVIDEGASFSQLSWRPDGADLAYLRSHSRPGISGMTFDVIAIRGAGRGAVAPTAYDPALDQGFPAATRIVDFRTPLWSTDGRTVFVGIADGAREVTARNDSDVRIWHWTDVEVMPHQVENVDKNARQSRLAAVHLDERRLIPITTSLTERATPIANTSLAWIADWSRSAMMRSFGRPTADLAIVDTRTGQRTVFASDVDDHDVHVDPHGRALIFVKSDHVWSLNIATRVLTDLSTRSGAVFIDTAADDTASHQPLFGVEGWTTDGAVLLNDRYDIWRVSTDGASAQRITDGAATQTRHRLETRGTDTSTIDLSQPLYIALFGERTKQSGYARRTPGGVIERLLYKDRHIDSLTKASQADVYAFISQNFDVSPNIFVGSGALSGAKAVTRTNPDQANYTWGRSSVIDFTTADGASLQAALYYPAGYVAGRRYPTIVKIYEQLSDDVHDYVSPSDMDEANIAIFTGLGYAVLAPDIRYRPRDPGISTVACVTAAVARAVALGVTDAAHVGVIGHSWGAYESAFLATHTTGIFAAAVAGSPITDLISQYGNHHWGSGVAETDHIETGQQRMQVPFYEDVDAYVRNSPIFGAATMTTPLLLEAGDQDGDVFWHQSVELYNAARRAQKPVVLLQYPEEDHVLDDFDNRRDYQRRILEWFGHFLKNETAPRWITTGTPYVKK